MSTTQVLCNSFDEHDAAATENRQRLDLDGVTCINLLGGAGCGKTSLLEAVIPRLLPTLRVAFLDGDLATTCDAERIDRLGVRVIQLLTDGARHLNATLVQHALEELALEDFDLVLIENVGNPNCPAHFDLGEHLRVAALGVPEGHDKVAKYPLLFQSANLVALTKCDLIGHCDFEYERVAGDLRRINPSADVLLTSARTGAGIDTVARWIGSRVESRLVPANGPDESVVMWCG